MQLVLSLFPGIGLLDMAFEQRGFCVVRGPDRIWGGDIKTFHPPAGKFNGIIGGPPCQCFSKLMRLSRHVNGEESVAENLIPEFERCILAALPHWYVMENVPGAPEPNTPGYAVHSVLLNNRWFGGVQNRERRISFGVRGATLLNIRRYIETEPFERLDYHDAVVAQGIYRKHYIQYEGRTIQTSRPTQSEATVKLSKELQGLPETFLDGTPMTVKGKQMMIGNGVPLPLGRAIADAVARMIGGLQ